VVTSSIDNNQTHAKADDATGNQVVGRNLLSIKPEKNGGDSNVYDYYYHVNDEDTVEKQQPKYNLSSTDSKKDMGRNTKKANGRKLANSTAKNATFPSQPSLGELNGETTCKHSKQIYENSTESLRY